ncbi:MAG: TetR family transcriptional regulator [Acidimicrobiia bacterium]|nr:TetR family transcriptional regulator [Acidimicrobiia bacterium]
MSVAYETTRRRLTDRQVEAAEQLLNAAEIEVEQTGYDALSMRGVAKRAGLASATAYTYFSSKDHLLGELLWRRIAAVPETKNEQSAKDVSPLAARLARVVYDLGEITNGSPEVIAACTQALLSSNPDVKPLRDRIGLDIRRRMTDASGDQRDNQLIDVLVTTYFGALLSAGMGHMKHSDVPAFVESALLLMTERREDFK